MEVQSQPPYAASPYFCPKTRGMLTEVTDLIPYGHKRVSTHPLSYVVSFETQVPQHYIISERVAFYVRVMSDTHPSHLLIAGFSLQLCHMILVTRCDYTSLCSSLRSAFNLQEQIHSATIKCAAFKIDVHYLTLGLYAQQDTCSNCVIRNKVLYYS